MPASVDLEKETVITGRVVDRDGQAVGGAFVRLLDSSGEFTADKFEQEMQKNADTLVKALLTDA